MSEEEIRKRFFSLLAKSGAMLLLWAVLSWFIADAVLKTHTREHIRREAADLQTLVGSTAQSIDLGLDYLHEIPELVAKDDLIRPAMLRFGSTVPSGLPAAKRKEIWSNNSLLRDIDKYLDQVRKTFGGDVVWIANAAGDCIASSNADTPESFVGTNYADREYFLLAREGKPGRQYAMGRLTNIPGLYFSAPIVLDGRFVGVAVAKMDLSRLHQWVNHTDAFLADEHGVIILARDASLEMRALPGTGIAQLSEAERLARYKRTEFPPLAITPWDRGQFPPVQQFDRENRPLLISSKSITDETLEISVTRFLPAVADFGIERLKLFLLILAPGALVISVTGGTLLFLRVRKHTELRKAKSASLLRAALEATADGILVLDNHRRITAVNQRFIDIWHIPPELVADGRDEEVLECAANQVMDRQEFVDKVKHLFGHPELIAFDTLHLKDGTDIERYSAPQRLGDRIVGRVTSFRDVTKRTQAEQALRDSRDQLEVKVRERTADLQSANSALLVEKAQQEELIKQLAEAHTQLLQSEKMASIGQLAAGVAHEINNPVGYVNSNMQTLQEYVDSLFRVLSAYEQRENELTAATQAEIAALKKKLDVAYVRNDIGKLMSESIGGLQRVKRIVLDLKDFSHVGESAKLWSNIERGMDSTLNVVWNELKYKAEVVKEYAGLPDIECIPMQINQVFMNLLMNAAQAIKEHGRITIRTGQEKENVWVEVEDTGCGIEPGNLKRIFDPFFTTKPVGQGTGLGLSLSYSIVKKHGGRIEVRSEVGKGTVFRVVLPMQSPDGGKIAEPGASAS
ncbi:MAG: ATP-binding protein [Sideroxyarcus sp.]|nr:ATP-binding protein [Sideroxyarcus sp.]